VGKDNDAHIRRIAARFQAIFVAWGTNGRHLDRDREVLGLLAQLRRPELLCFGTNQDGSPKHPLHLSGRLHPIIYRP
jgi:hypothetical protein